LRARTWERWDSTLYLDIAENGYTLTPCPDRPSQWCGNAGWFPLYPWVIGALHRLGLPLRGTAVALSWLFAGATLSLLWRTFLARTAAAAAGSGAAAVGALAYAAFAPGQIYGYAVFPLSMLAFFTVAHLWCLWRERFVLAGLAGAAAALSYPIGVLLAPVAAIWLLSDRSVPWWARVRRAAVASGLIAAGFALLLLVQWAQTGRWDAYFLVHEKYAHGFDNPLASVWNDVHYFFEGWGLILDQVPRIQTVFVAVVLVSVLVAMAMRRATWTRLHLLLVLWAVVTWAFPLTQANISPYRAHAALLPLAVLVRDLPRPLRYGFVAGAVALSVPMASLYLQGRLV
jgi:4-amino-4-deoxy-L-arabinose transferase-like glycosyltransferase